MTLSSESATGSGVTNVRSCPTLAPFALETFNRKWYLLNRSRPSTRAHFHRSTTRRPRRTWYALAIFLLGPYSNAHSLTGSPSGFATPFTVTDVSAKLDAEPALTSGTTNAVNTSISWLAPFDVYTAPVANRPRSLRSLPSRPDPNRSTGTTRRIERRDTRFVIDIHIVTGQIDPEPVVNSLSSSSSGVHPSSKTPQAPGTSLVRGGF